MVGLYIIIFHITFSFIRDVSFIECIILFANNSHAMCAINIITIITYAK